MPRLYWVRRDVINCLTGIWRGWTGIKGCDVTSHDGTMSSTENTMPCCETSPMGVVYTFPVSPRSLSGPCRILSQVPFYAHTHACNLKVLSFPDMWLIRYMWRLPNWASLLFLNKMSGGDRRRLLICQPHLVPAQRCNKPRTMRIKIIHQRQWSSRQKKASPWNSIWSHLASTNGLPTYRLLVKKGKWILR